MKVEQFWKVFLTITKQNCNSETGKEGRNRNHFVQICMSWKVTLGLRRDRHVPEGLGEAKTEVVALLQKV